MNGFKPYISDFIRKHDVNRSTDGVPEIINYARHAEEVTKKKAKKNLQLSICWPLEKSTTPLKYSTIKKVEENKGEDSEENEEEASEKE